MSALSRLDRTRVLVRCASGQIAGSQCPGGRKCFLSGKTLCSDILRVSPVP